ncbi:NIPSNAP family protein [Micrococcoides hystricis]|uniref:NIPSNAP family protein n=1 Tax=Micrococcoides hystricis TaxID=1572761 RepID=A0ABV6PAS5_9MICC
MFELRTYTATDGNRETLVNRFRDETIALFTEHNITTVGFWVDATDENKLHYLVKHEGDPRQNWSNFVADERWTELKARTEADGPLTADMSSIFLEPTEFSGLK